VSGRSDIERLIELGLNRYGAGDLEGALLMWEEALAIDPDNATANSYVDYLRANYEALADGELAVEDAGEAPFAIEEEPEYQIELDAPLRHADSSPEPLPEAAALISLDPIDRGWDMEATHDVSAAARSPDHADDDDVAPPPGPAEDSFEDATREYHGVAQQIAQPILPPPGSGPHVAAAELSDEYTGDFPPEGTGGFGSIPTGVRKRELGFVQPTLEHDDATHERSPFRGAEPAVDPADEALSGSMPAPRPADAEPESGEIILPKAATREMPVMSRQPARRDSEALSKAEIVLAHAQTRELTASELRAHTEAKDRRLDPMVTAPTRELGLRPGGRPLANPADDDVPTGQTDVRAIRAAAARGDGAARGEEGTRHDIVLPFDPIAARTAQILDEVDAEIPAAESKDDQTRRRIALLLERATAWSRSGELEKAVAAADLALSEDPNSVLGQKLITRNKDTIVGLFQSYLGDLERMPQLARPLHELANAPISPRAAFLLSRIDGTLTIDELLDVSGMPRLEAYRHLCQLFLRGILR
jgi:tetratricopeptide (TPR) repeat protein